MLQNLLWKSKVKAKLTSSFWVHQAAGKERKDLESRTRWALSTSHQVIFLELPSRVDPLLELKQILSWKKENLSLIPWSLNLCRLKSWTQQTRKDFCSMDSQEPLSKLSHLMRSSPRMARKSPRSLNLNLMTNFLSSVLKEEEFISHLEDLIMSNSTPQRLKVKMMRQVKIWFKELTTMLMLWRLDWTTIIRRPLPSLNITKIREFSSLLMPLRNQMNAGLRSRQDYEQYETKIKFDYVKQQI